MVSATDEIANLINNRKKQMTKADMIETIITRAIVAKSESTDEINASMEKLIRMLDLTDEFNMKKTALGMD